MPSAIASFLRLASIVLCLIVGVSFVLFAISRTSDASAHQQRMLNGEIAPPQEGETAAEAAAAAKKTSTNGQASKGSSRRVIDEVAEAVTSPFSGLIDNSSSEWLKRGVLLALTLAIYGFGLSFIARAIRVRL
ncbi:MAG TPA: hypothetical protein VLJ80_05075 [Solirubrobacteraceae bacterium]|nr:hypothetical protein [Solirubrobacteraceae bacterium]